MWTRTLEGDTLSSLSTSTNKQHLDTTTQNYAKNTLRQICLRGPARAFYVEGRPLLTFLSLFDFTNSFNRTVPTG